MAQIGVDERYRSPSLGKHDSKVGCDSRFAVLRARAGDQHHCTLLINRCELQRRPEPAERLAFGCRRPSQSDYLGRPLERRNPCQRWHARRGCLEHVARTYRLVEALPQQPCAYSQDQAKHTTQDDISRDLRRKRRLREVRLIDDLRTPRSATS